MSPLKVMVIRHAEKPDGTGGVLGVDEAGRPDPNQLCVRGWQRAGALVRFFAPASGDFAEGIATPSAIFACKPYGAANSVRPFSTVSPLAKALGIPVNHEIGKRDMCALLHAVMNSQGTVLICWSHKLLPSIIRGVAGELPGLPANGLQTVSISFGYSTAPAPDGSSIRWGNCCCRVTLHPLSRNDASHSPLKDGWESGAPSPISRPI